MSRDESCDALHRSPQGYPKSLDREYWSSTDQQRRAKSNVKHYEMERKAQIVDKADPEKTRPADGTQMPKTVSSPQMNGEACEYTCIFDDGADHDE